MVRDYQLRLFSVPLSPFALKFTNTWQILISVSPLSLSSADSRSFLSLSSCSPKDRCSHLPYSAHSLSPCRSLHPLSILLSHPFFSPSLSACLYVCSLPILSSSRLLSAFVFLKMWHTIMGNIGADWTTEAYRRPFTFFSFLPQPSLTHKYTQNVFQSVYLQHFTSPLSQAIWGRASKANIDS